MSDTFNHETDAYNEKMRQETTELDHHTALQKFYEKMMGPWKWYDRWYDPEDKEEGVVLPGQVREFRKVGGDFKDFLRIPLTIDDRNPEAFKRSLLGMLYNFIQIEKYRDSIWKLVVSMKDGLYYDFKADTPTLAILRALCAQEGITI